LQPRHSRGAVAAHRAGTALRLADQAEALVVTDGFLVDARFAGDLTDGEIVQTNLPRTR
jgi:hypothetical protein